ncbi:hypothetical protein FOA52_012136 [Chlamydomonas sp. UWO 241]|nr:hypothetical protein FOA52_012136 [Chlamydomonas sp. UWO 241]
MASVSMAGASMAGASMRCTTASPQPGIAAQSVPSCKYHQERHGPGPGRGLRVVASAGGSDEPDNEALKKKYFKRGGPPAVPESSRDEADTPSPAPPADDDADTQFVGRWFSPVGLGREARKALDANGVDMSGVDSVNPYQLGAKARRAFDDVWRSVSSLGAPGLSRGVGSEELLELDTLGHGSEVEVPQAAYTTVLVVGATGRVGRILTRKLLLRGYKVRALVRRDAEGGGAGGVGVPAAVKLVFGDVGETRDCQEAVKGVDKIIYCAGARSSFTTDLLRVEEAGVRNLVKAYQDEMIRTSRRAREGDASARVFTDKSKRELADFKVPYHQKRWDVTFVGVPDVDEAAMSERAREVAKYNQAFAEINSDDNLVFDGVLYQRGAVAEVGAKVDGLMPGGEHRTAGTEGVVMRLRGDGKPYALVVKTTDGHAYAARFPTRAGYQHVRLPWSAFRDEGAKGQPTFDPAAIAYVGVRYEFRRGDRGTVPMTSEEVETAKKDRQFELEIDWIKALPGGVEPDFVLVSRAGAASSAAATPEPTATELAATAGGVPRRDEAAKLLEFKRRGEELLRQSGLGYTIVRPGALVEEPGGYRALVFDQGNRITEAVGAADVADICLRALHEPAARNKTFDVCYEYQTEQIVT